MSQFTNPDMFVALDESAMVGLQLEYPVLYPPHVIPYGMDGMGGWIC